MERMPSLPGPRRVVFVPPPRHCQPFLCLVLTAATALLLSACRSVDPAPFVTFSTSLQALQSSVDTSLSPDVASMEQRYVTDTAQLSGEQLLAATSPLKFPAPDSLEPKRDPFVWNASNAFPENEAKPLPLFLEAERLLASVRALNASLAMYGRLLVQLTSPELITKEQFSQLSTNLNSNSFSALTALSGKSPDPNTVALFSTAAGIAAQAFIESRRQRDLETALTGNQDAIDALAALGQKVARGLAYSRWNDYQDDAQDSLKAILLAPSPDARQTGLVRLITLDRRQMDALEVLRSLNDAYAALPGAHRELRRAIGNPSLTLVSIQALYADAQRIASLYANSRLANQARLDSAAAEAAAAEPSKAKAKATPQ